MQVKKLLNVQQAWPDIFACHANNLSVFGFLRRRHDEVEGSCASNRVHVHVKFIADSKRGLDTVGHCQQETLPSVYV